MSDESKVLAVIDGVNVTEEMVSLYADRFAEENVESNQAGLVGSIGAWITGTGTPDSYLTDSPETRDVFAPVRKAYFATKGQNSDEVAFSNVSFAEGCEKGRAAKELNKKTAQDHESEEAAKAATEKATEEAPKAETEANPEVKQPGVDAES